jgi:hypothetical protein
MGSLFITSTTCFFASQWRNWNTPWDSSYSTPPVPITSALALPSLNTATLTFITPIFNVQQF